MNNTISILSNKNNLILKISENASMHDIKKELKKRLPELKKFYQEEKNPILVTGKILKSKEVYEIQDKVVKYYPNEIARLEKRITLLGEDIERAKQNTKTTEDNKFSPMTLGDTIYTERQEE